MQAIHRDIFQTRIWVFDLPELIPLHPHMINNISILRGETPDPAGRSNRRGWNSQPIVFKRDEFNSLRDKVYQAFISVFNEMRSQKPFKFALEAWINLLDPGAFNALHLHCNVLLCACYYLKIPKGSGPIRFRDPRPGVVLSPFVSGGVNTCNDYLILPKCENVKIFSSEENRLPRIR